MDDETTIGTIEFDGIEYEIDWPFRLDDETEREDFSVVYRDGDMVAEFMNPYGESFRDADQVLEVAREVIEENGGF